jgi:hypothetical protein
VQLSAIEINFKKPLAALDYPSAEARMAVNGRSFAEFIEAEGGRPLTATAAEAS